MRQTLPAFQFAIAMLGIAMFATTPSVAHAEDESDGAFHSLDSVDDGETHSLDSVDDDETTDLDSVDHGKTHDLDEVDGGQTRSLDSVSTGRTVALDEVATGRTESLDSVAERANEAPVSFPAPATVELPPIEDGNWEAQAERAKGFVAAAEDRLDFANQRYANMIRNDYPRGDARAAVIAERDTAQSEMEKSQAYLAQVKERAAAAGRPL